MGTAIAASRLLFRPRMRVRPSTKATDVSTGAPSSIGPIRPRNASSVAVGRGDLQLPPIRAARPDDHAARAQQSGRRLEALRELGFPLRARHSCHRLHARLPRPPRIVRLRRDTSGRTGGQCHVRQPNRAGKRRHGRISGHALPEPPEHQGNAQKHKGQASRGGGDLSHTGTHDWVYRPMRESVHSLTDWAAARPWLGHLARSTGSGHRSLGRRAALSHPRAGRGSHTM